MARRLRRLLCLVALASLAEAKRSPNQVVTSRVPPPEGPTPKSGVYFKHGRGTECGTCFRKNGSVQTGKTLQFVHVHKSGGTSMCRLAMKNSCGVPNGGKFNCNVAKEEWTDAKEFSGSMEAQKDFYNKHLTCTGYVANEFPLADDMWVNDTSYVYFTMLRNPLDRVRSHYQEKCGLVRANGLEDPCSSLSLFWERNPDNWVTRQFCGRTCAQKARGDLDLSDLEAAKRNMDNMGLVLVLEEFQSKGRFLLKEKLGWTKYNNEHRQMGAHSNKPQEGGDADVAQRLRQLNLLDIALFDHAQFLFQQQYARSHIYEQQRGRYAKGAESMQAPVVSDELKQEIETFRAAASNCSNPCCLGKAEQKEPLRWSIYVRSLCGATLHPQFGHHDLRMRGRGR